MTFFSLAAAAMIGTACERHPASELAGGHGSGGEPVAATETDLHRGSPETPPGPGAAAPATVKDETNAPPAPTATPAAKPPASKFFPSNQ